MLTNDPALPGGTAHVDPRHLDDDADPCRESLIPQLAREAAVANRVSGGYRLRFSASSDMLLMIAEVIDAERLCSPKLQFDLSVASDQGEMTLTITGPDDEMAALHDQMPLDA